MIDSNIKCNIDYDKLLSTGNWFCPFEDKPEDMEDNVFIDFLMKLCYENTKMYWNIFTNEYGDSKGFLITKAHQLYDKNGLYIFDKDYIISDNGEKCQASYVYTDGNLKLSIINKYKLTEEVECYSSYELSKEDSERVRKILNEQMIEEMFPDNPKTRKESIKPFKLFILIGLVVRAVVAILDLILIKNIDGSSSVFFALDMISTLSYISIGIGLYGLLIKLTNM